MGLPPNGGPGEKLVEQMVSVALVSSELQRNEEESPLLSHGQHMQYRKEEDFAVAKTDCERVSGDASTTFAAFMVHTHPSFFMKLFGLRKPINLDFVV